MFSVILPVYNRENAILKAVNSVLDQSYSNWELIIVNDCSTDNTIAVLAQVTDERIKILTLPKNSGAAVARNVGIEASSGEYISLLDSDDFYDPEFLSESFNTIEGTNPLIGFMWTGVRYIQNGKSIEYIWKPEPKSSSYQTFLHSLHIGTNSGITFKRGTIAKCGIFREDLPAVEDTEFFLRITKEFDFTYNTKPLINIEKDSSDRLSKNLKKVAIAYNRFLPDHFSVIEQDRELQGKFYYKMMWLNFHLDDSEKALFFFRQIPREYISFKIKFIKFLYDNFPLKSAAFIHQKFSS